MKKNLKILGVVIGGVILLFVVVGLVLPKEYDVSRTQVIDAPAAVVFAQVNDLQKNEGWNPWKAKDQTMKVSYGAQTVGTGASYSWKGEKSGTGTLTIAKSDAPRHIENTVEFDGMSTATGYWDFVEKDGKTNVTWGFRGSNPGVMGGYFTLAMDKMVGADFESGLEKLKEVAEAPPAEVVEEPVVEEAPEGGEAPVEGASAESNEVPHEDDATAPEGGE